MYQQTVVKIAHAAKNSLILLIRGYAYLISPCLGHCCRFHPSCSQYAQMALEQYGVFRGIWISLCRLLRCHPWHPGGYDPVLKNQPKE